VQELDNRNFVCTLITSVEYLPYSCQ